MNYRRGLRLESLEHRLLLTTNTTQAVDTLTDLSFRTWAPTGSSALLVESETSLVSMQYQIDDGGNSMAMVRATYPDTLYPQGVDFSCGVTLPLRADSPSLAITFHDVNGSVRNHHIDNLLADADTLKHFIPGDFSGLGYIRKIDFIIAEDLQSGWLHVGHGVDASGGDPTTEEPAPEEEVPPDTGDTTGSEGTAELSAVLADLSFHVWAPEGSTANLVDPADNLVVMDYQIGETNNSMALLRGTFPTNLFPDGVDLSGGVAFQLRTDATSVLVTFHDIHGQVRNHWLTELSSIQGSSHEFLPVDLAGLAPIRKIDFIVVDKGTTGALQVNPIQQTADPCQASSVECIRAGDETQFLQTIGSAGPSRQFYIYPDAQLTNLNIVDRVGDEFHFVDGAQVTGNVQTPGPWTIDRGVINIMNSSNLLISGLTATNEYQYQAVNSTEDVQSSTALNISWSHDIVVENAQLVGNGKSTVWIQGNSTVQLRDTAVDCYYFCLGIAASDVQTKNLTVAQFNAVTTGDKHAAFWISSTMRSAVDNTFYGNSNVIFEDTTIHKQTGEGMVVGNGGYAYASDVTFRGTTQVVATDYAAQAVDAWLPIHRNYNGITVHLEDNYQETTVDLATEPGTFGRFVIHQFGSSDPPPYESPLVVCIGQSCVTSNDVLGL